jgi:hypothetical protein
LLYWFNKLHDCHLVHGLVPVSSTEIFFILLFSPLEGSGQDSLEDRNYQPLETAVREGKKEITETEIIM